LKPLHFSFNLGQSAEHIRTFSIKCVCPEILSFSPIKSFQKSKKFGNYHPEKPEEAQGASLSPPDYYLRKKTNKQT